MPRAFNPEDGFIATANSKATSERLPGAHLEGVERALPQCQDYRADKVQGEALPEDMRDIQADTLTWPGRDFARMVLRAASVDGPRVLSPGAAGALELLESWDFRADRESAAMSIYFYSWRHLRQMVLEHRLGTSLLEEYLSSWPAADLAVENILEARDEFWLPPGRLSFDELLLASLEEGVRELERGVRYRRAVPLEVG